jgi:hypothetical protein
VKCEQIISGFRALQNSDFDDMNVDARGHSIIHFLDEARWRRTLRVVK